MRSQPAARKWALQARSPRENHDCSTRLRQVVDIELSRRHSWRMRLAKAEQHCLTSSDTVLCCRQSTDVRRSFASHYHTWVATIASAGRTRTQTKWKFQSLCRALMTSSATATPHAATKHAAFEQHSLVYSRDTCRQRLEDTRRLQQERARARVRLPVCPASFALWL